MLIEHTTKIAKWRKKKTPTKLYAKFIVCSPYWPLKSFQVFEVFSHGALNALMKNVDIASAAWLVALSESLRRCDQLRPALQLIKKDATDTVVCANHQLRLMLRLWCVMRRLSINHTAINEGWRHVNDSNYACAAQPSVKRWISMQYRLNVMIGAGTSSFWLENLLR